MAISQNKGMKGSVDQVDNDGRNNEVRTKIPAVVAIVLAVASFAGNIYNIFCYFTGAGMSVLAAVTANLCLVAAIIAFVVLLRRKKYSFPEVDENERKLTPGT
jgi:glycerol-3-phosphate acyltransferase PlsY